MKKIFFSLGILFFLTSFHFALATENTVKTPVQTGDGIWTISGTLGTELLTKHRSSLDIEEMHIVVAVEYGIITSEGNQPNLLYKDCSTPDEGGNFTCELTGLQNAKYGYHVGVYSVFVDAVKPQYTEKDALFSNQLTFTATGTKSESNPAATFGSVVVSEKNARITFSVSNIPTVMTGYLELGIATQTEKTAKYTCSAGGPISPKITIPVVTTGSKEMSYSFAPPDFPNGLPDGVYCIRPLVDLPSLPKSRIGQGSGVDPNTGFWTAQNSIFGINVKIDPNATNDPEANDLGCKYEKDNKSYCLLAPLPGVGDTTGKLDVTKGMGDYFNMIIKIVMGIIGVLAVLMVIVGGIEYMSTVNIGEKEGARARIGSALLGLLLALSAYLILKAVNPDLVNVNIGVPEGTIEAGGDEGPEETTVAPTANPDVSGVKVESGPARDLALKILQNSKITFNGGKNEARATPKQNIVDISKGENAWTSSRGHKGAVQTSIDSRLLAGILAAANVSPIQINEIAGGRHSGPSSAHYTGHAVDIQSSPNDTARAKQIMNACLAAGARKGQIFGPCNNKYLPDHEFSACDATGGYLTNADHQTHIHCTW